MAERELGYTETFVVRYPDGSSEYRMSELAPQVGDVLVGRGAHWLVAGVAEYAKGTMTIFLQHRQAASPQRPDSRRF